MLSAVFVHSENYGTRASTVALRDRQGRIRFHERTFGPGGVPGEATLVATGE